VCDHSPGFPAGVVTTCVKYILSGEISDFCVETYCACAVAQSQAVNINISSVVQSSVCQD